MNESLDWVKEFPAVIEVCDAEGNIVALNQKAIEKYAVEGGEKLIGSSLFDCHPESANVVLRAMLAEQRSNIYTIQKNGVKKLVFQSPWYKDGEFAGIVEILLELPVELKHFNRDI
ncbi:MAG: diguanylate cyclase [Chloroflexi bacterium]|nr:MAG: diguanylate cyclase [Chloroflexota bacterium]